MPRPYLVEATLLQVRKTCARVVAARRYADLLEEVARRG